MKVFLMTNGFITGTDTLQWPDPCHQVTTDFLISKTDKIIKKTILVLYLSVDITCYIHSKYQFTQQSITGSVVCPTTGSPNGLWVIHQIITQQENEKYQLYIIFIYLRIYPHFLWCTLTIYMNIFDIWCVMWSRRVSFDRSVILWQH